MSDLGGLQGNVLVGYRTEHAAYLFASVTDAGQSRRWLAGSVEQVTTHRSWAERPTPVTLNVAFGYDGLLAMGVPAGRIEHLEAFSQGMAARAEKVLGDTGESAPGRWEKELCDSHMLVTMTAGDRSQLERDARRMKAVLEGAGFKVGKLQDAHGLPDGREHFGFQDGFSQPAIPGGEAPTRGEGTRTRLGRWRKLAIGEVVLGYPGEGGWPAPAPHGPLGEDATFVAVRKLEQEVVLFRRYTRERAEALRCDPVWLAAKMVGRWQNGSALARYPDRPGPAAGRDQQAFSYGQDATGLACPLGAHVRRANPRDALGWQGRLTRRHRIIRRGMSYGPLLPPQATGGDDEERGLMFVCYQSALERQFEFIQAQWLSDGNPLGVGADGDPLLGPQEASGEMVIQGRPPRYLKGLPGFVRVRGGGYYLLPGLAGLSAIADGSC